MKYKFFVILLVISSFTHVCAVRAAQESAPASRKALWGAYVPDHDIVAFEKVVGKSVDIQATFVGWGDAGYFPTALAESLKSSNRILQIFWEPTDGRNKVFSLESISSGQWDEYIKEFVAEAKEYGNIILLVPMPEMNGNWSPWSGAVKGNDAKKFIAAWRHLRVAFKTAPNVIFGWAVNAVSVPNQDGNRISDYYPGPEFVDIVGLDGFNFANDGAWDTFDSIFTPGLRVLSGYKKPIFIFSMACQEDARKADWITDAMNKIKMYQIAGWVWFNEDKERHWPVSSGKKTLAAFKAALP